MPRWLLPFLAGVLTVALVTTSAVAVVQHRRAASADARADALEAEVARLQERIDRLERDAERSDGDESDLLGDLFGGLFGGDGELDGLLGGLGGGLDDIPGGACLVPSGQGGLDGLLDDLLGDGDLGGLLGGLSGGSSDTVADPEALVAEASEQVAELRELAWQEEVRVDFLDDAQIRQRLLELVDEEYAAEDADIDSRLLKALGAIPQNADLRELYVALLQDQVAGFYHQETGELVVRAGGEGIGPADQVTLAHELQHALADQVLGLPDLTGDNYADDADGALGAIAVVEGDASLLMNHWALTQLGLGDQMAMAMDPSIAAAQASLQDLPPFMVAELMYPYTSGLDYVCDLWLDGGWGAVDAAYDSPPGTSAEVLWDDHPGRVAEPTALGAPAGYDEALTTTFGAAPLRWLLEAPGGEDGRALDDADGRARAWGGGQATVWTRGSDTAVGLSLVDRGGGPDLCTTVTDWYGAAFPDATRGSEGDATVYEGDGQAAALTCPGDQVHVAIAPDTTTATGIVDR